MVKKKKKKVLRHSIFTAVLFDFWHHVAIMSRVTLLLTTILLPLLLAKLYAQKRLSRKKWSNIIHHAREDAKINPLKNNAVRTSTLDTRNNVSTVESTT